MYTKKRNVSTAVKSLNQGKRNSVVTHAGKSTMKKKKENQVKKQNSDIKKSENSKVNRTKSVVSLKGNQKNDYIIVVQDGKSYFDLPITHEELYELYKLLENKFGEFIGYKIK